MNRLPHLVAAIGCVALLGASTLASSRSNDDPLPEAFASIDDSVRFVPSTQPERPEPQRPPLSTPENVDTDRPPHAWQRLTDDWGGLRPRLEDRGISLNGSFTGDLFQNLRGGANTADTDFTHLTNLNLTLDTERLFGLHGGTFFANVQHIGGDDPSANVGDWQAVSSIAAERRDQISEFWYEQVAGAVLRLKFGKIDANNEFGDDDYSGDFLNGSSGMSPTVPGFVTYPDNAFGGVVELKLCDHAYVRLGVFDGAGQEGKTTGDDGPHSLLGGPADLLWAGELGFEWTVASLKGHFAVGGTYHTGTFETFDGDPQDGAAGAYLVLGHQLTRENPADEDDEQGAAMFLRAGIDEADVNDVRFHAGAGLLYTGPIPSRDDDKIGLAVNWVGFSPEATDFDGGDEVNVELFYKLQLTHYLSVQPDVQYVHNVGGQASLDDAVVAGLRFDLQF